MRKDGIKNKFYKSIRKVMATAVAGCMLVASPYTFAADADDYKAWLLDFESGTTGVQSCKHRRLRARNRSEN